MSKLLVPSINNGTPELTVCYRKYATLFFAAIIDQRESKLATIDLIELFVKILDRLFPDISELDIVYNYEKIIYVLEELVQGGMILETSLDKVLNVSQPTNPDWFCFFSRINFRQLKIKVLYWKAPERIPSLLVELPTCCLG